MRKYINECEGSEEEEEEVVVVVVVEFVLI
jgi:hypothetical protein